MGLFKNVGLKAKLMLGSCSPLILVIILSVVTYISIGSLLKNNHWVDHTHKVIAEAKSIEAAAVDMETGMRGFLLAGKEEFLDPYKGGQKRFYEPLCCQSNQSCHRRTERRCRAGDIRFRTGLRLQSVFG